MKLHNALWVPAVIGALSGMATNAYAVGTTAGTTINNTATLDFKVGATDQPQVESTHYWRYTWRPHQLCC